MNADPLAALLVKEGVLPAARVDEAQERMVLAGGTLDTALLELGFLDEPRMLELLPRAYQARLVLAAELKAIDKGVTSLFPRRLAEKHGVVPIEVSGRRLTVAIAGPPDLGLLDEIGFMLSVYVKPAVTTQARVAWALAAHYGVPVPPRFVALLTRLGLAVAPTPAPASSPPTPAPAPAPRPQRPVPSGATADGWQTRTTHGAPMAHAVASESVVDVVDPPQRDKWAIVQSAVMARDEPSAPALSEEGGGSIAARAEAQQQELVDAERAEVLKRRREKVLWTVDDAIAELALAEDRDGMLEVVLRFAHRRLSTVAAFILQRESIAERSGAKGNFVCFDLIDALLDKKDVATFALPATGSHALAQVYSMRSPFLGPLRTDDPLVRLFGRRARASILTPILVGDRFLGVLYGDAGARSVPPSSLAELHMVVPRLGKGLGNLILRKKKALRAAAAIPDVRIDAERAALAALDIPIVVVGELEEEIAVSALAPVRHLPSIDIDFSDSDLDGPLAPIARPQFEPPAALTITEPPHAADPESEPQAMPWADGRDDDEDVRLDAFAMSALEVPAAQRQSARIELGLDANMGPSVHSDNSDDELDELSAADIASVPDAPVVSVPDGDMPAPSAEPPLTRVATGTPTVALSPGAHARESLLAATHSGWLAHDDAELDDLVGHLHRPGDKEKKLAVAAVVAHGDRAMPSLARYFPGVLAVHPFGSMAERPEVPELSDCLACLSRLGPDRAAPILVGELVADDRLHRWTAVWALSALRVPSALPRLAQRVFDPEPSIAALAIEVLDSYRSEETFSKVLAQVRDLLRRGDAFERERAIAAVGDLKDRESLPALVDLLGTRPKDIADQARRALVDVTKQDFGTAERRWRAWIADNEKTPRTRWLIDGLSAKDDDIRRTAQVELNRMTGQFFGYRWDAPRTDREASLSQWQEWWAAQEASGRFP